MSTATHVEQATAPPQESPVPRVADPRPRLDSIDLMRGLVMVLMVLDHTKGAFWTAPFDPLNADATNLPTYLTRWITHLCAPTFCFLMGTGAYLSGRRRTRPELAWHLLTRGLWLVVLEVTLVKFGLQFNFSLDMTIALVFWSLGWSLVFLAALVFLPVRVVGAIGVAMILAHNLLDGINPEVFGPLRPLWLILHQPGVIALTAHSQLLIAYPLIPWVGVAAAGYGFGEVVTMETKRCRTVMIALGLTLTAAFFLLRWFNAYGDPLKWQPRADALRTCFSFFNTQKYPPSLLFLLMTLGPMFLLLALLERPVLPAPISRFLITLGRVPLFFFVAQWYVIKLLAIAVASARGFSPAYLYVPGVPEPPGVKFELPMVYVWFVVVLILLYFPSRWFAGVKARHKDVWWLSYL
jgi:uncharacterized membrane protein